MIGLLRGLLLAFLLMPVQYALADSEKFSFGVIGHAFRKAPDEEALARAIAESDADSLGFVVVNGIKSAGEPCSDALYERRRTLLARAKNGLVLSLAGSDWAECRHANGRPAAIERLTRVRDVYFQEEASYGDSKIPLMRESATTKFRSYAENARWEIGGIQFATLNLPANNNHYLPDAGRNSEFEDRLIANRYWLRRLFHSASRQHLAGIVLFCDGDPMSVPQNVRRDGFQEIRRELLALASRYPGRVLVIHGRDEPGGDAISWRGNLGTLGAGAGWVKVRVDPGAPALFELAGVLPARSSR
jgi:hypothetical protein